jgi:cytochrome P450
VKLAGGNVFDPFSPMPTAERYAALADLRRTAPLARIAAGPWLAADMASVLSGLKAVEHFAGSFGTTGTGPEDDQVMAAIPEPRHGKIRKIFNSALAYHHASRMESFARAQAVQRLDAARETCRRGGEVEAVEHWLAPIPSAVIAQVLGVPDADHARFARWSDELLDRQGQSDHEHTGMADVHPEFAGYVDGLIEARRSGAAPPDDVISRMLFTEIEGERLSARMVRTQTMFLIIAGNETTRNVIGNCVYRLASDLALQDQIRRDAALIPALIEETLRLDAPVQLLGRTCMRPLELEGIPIEEGDRVLFHLASANRDPAAFEEPDAFRLGRRNARDHVAFGAGAHVCPGAYLARMETRVVLETLLARTEKIALAPGYTWDPNPVFWALGPRTLRVTLQ